MPYLFNNDVQQRRQSVSGYIFRLDEYEMVSTGLVNIVTFGLL